ncbi:hypothetical protein HY994_05330 [Candidatus Micrarchaeota archaeon]|nr:hypothetical protein [Candidatus Micrarchaeota archaeon]
MTFVVRSDLLSLGRNSAPRDASVLFSASAPSGESVPVSTSAVPPLSGSKRRWVLIPRVVSFRVDGVAYASMREDEAHARWIGPER